MAHVIEITNMFNPLEDSKVTPVTGAPTIREWLTLRFGGAFVEFPHPTVCIVNGNPVLRKDWPNTPILPGDVVNFVTVPHGAAAIFWFVIAMVVSVAMTLIMKTDVPTMEDNRAESVYNISGKTNQLKLNKPIESVYGKCRLYPSYGAMPYNFYSANDQWICELFCLGHGEFDVHSILIEDTPIGDYSNVTYQVIPPGQPVTLFPDNVVVSTEVSNIELFGPNEGRSNGEWIEVTPAITDPFEGEDYPANGYYGYNSAGPFTVVPTGGLATSLEFDISLPNGLYFMKDNGKLAIKSLSFTFEYRQINDAGVAIGPWTVAVSDTISMATMTPQRRTLKVTVPSGRYEVRGGRTDAKDLTTRVGHTLVWEAARAFLPSKTTYPGVTMLAIRAKATNNLNNNASRRVNVWATRKLRTYTGSAWTGLVATRNPIWAFCDQLQSSYGGSLPDAYLDLGVLKTLADQAEARGDTFDHVFDNSTSLWEAGRVALLVMRAVPVVNGARVSAVRDEPKTLPVAVFNPNNMVEGSFDYSMKFRSSVSNDGLLVTYLDPDSFLQETVLCVLPDESGLNPEQVTLFGCADRARAYYWGMWRRSCQRLQRRTISFVTGREGHIPSYGDLISVSHDLPRWGKSGLVISISGTTLTLSEPVDLTVGGPYKIVLRKKNGDVTPAVGVTSHVSGDRYKVTTASALTASEFWFNSTHERPLFNIGVSDTYGRLLVVMGLQPEGEDRVAVNCLPYTSAIWSYDGTAVPPKGQTDGNLDPVPDLPAISLLQVKRTAGLGEVAATWNPAAGAKAYIIQRAYDLAAWETIQDNFVGTAITFPAVSGVQMYVRVAAITTDQGPWTIWGGICPALDTNISPADGNLVFNSGFEQLLQGWEFTATEAWPTDALAGGTCARIGATTGSLVSLAFPVSPGRRYRVLVAAKAASATTLGVRVRSQAGKPTGSVTGGTLTTLAASAAVGTTWSTLAYNFTAPAGHYWASLDLANTSGVPVQVDQIEVSAPADVTPPAVPSGFATFKPDQLSMPAITLRPALLPVWQGCTVTWSQNTEVDFSHYEVWVGLGAAGVTGPGSASGAKQTANFHREYTSDWLAHHVWVRSVDTSDNKSAWVNSVSGGLNSTHFGPVTGSMAVQDSTSVASSGFSLGSESASSVRKVIARYVGQAVLSFTAEGSNRGYTDIGISNRGFSAAPDVGLVLRATTSGAYAEYTFVYDPAASSSTSARVYGFAPVGTTFVGQVYNIMFEFVEYD